MPESSSHKEYIANHKTILERSKMCGLKHSLWLKRVHSDIDESFIAQLWSKDHQV